MPNDDKKLSSPSNGKTNVFGLLFVIAAIFALLVSYIKPIQSELEHIEGRLNNVYERAVQADHLQEITSLSERYNAISKDIQRSFEIESLHNERTVARLSKLEDWREEDDDQITNLLERIARLEERMKDHEVKTRRTP